jgi:hypothetical protein
VASEQDIGRELGSGGRGQDAGPRLEPSRSAAFSEEGRMRTIPAQLEIRRLLIRPSDPSAAGRRGFLHRRLAEFSTDPELTDPRTHER